eukprot:m.130659 g.130659  ORF g.130659 m.130659 type:complete len:61 (-) comp15725_c0_seq3:492-674(-)
MLLLMLMLMLIVALLFSLTRLVGARAVSLHAGLKWSKGYFPFSAIYRFSSGSQERASSNL